MAVEVVVVVMVVVLMGDTHLTEYCSCTYVIKFTNNDSCVQFLKYTKYNFIPQSSTIEKETVVKHNELVYILFAVKLPRPHHTHPSIQTYIHTHTHTHT